MKTLAMFLLAVLAAAHAQAQPHYDLKDVGFLRGFSQMTGVAIDLAGDIVGTASTGSVSGEHGFLYNGGRLIDLGSGGVYGINNAAEVLGYNVDSSGDDVPYLYHNGKSISLATGAYAITDRGQVLIQNDNSAVEILEPDGNIVSHTIINGYYFVGWAINDPGQVLGRNFIPSSYPGIDGDFYNQVLLVQPGGSYRIVFTAAESDYCFPVALNNSGYGVGNSLILYWDTLYTNFLYETGDARLYNPDGTSVDLGTLYPGTSPIDGRISGSNVCGINAAGIIVGNCQSVFTGEIHAFVYINGKMYDLNDLVTITSLTITQANGINGLGQIVGTATDRAGNEHAIILTVARNL
jgi:probable HAF family extracellular repeat protein